MLLVVFPLPFGDVLCAYAICIRRKQTNMHIEFNGDIHTADRIEHANPAIDVCLAGRITLKLEPYYAAYTICIFPWRINNLVKCSVFMPQPLLSYHLLWM